MATDPSGDLEQIFQEDQADRNEAQKAVLQQAAQERPREETRARNERVRNLLHEAYCLAGDAVKDLSDQEKLVRLAKALIAAGQAAEQATGRATLDTLAMTDTPDRLRSHLRPLRFLIELLKRGRNNELEVILASLEKLRNSSDLCRFVDWFGAVADALCGSVVIWNAFHFPQPFPMPEGDSTSETWDAIYRVLGGGQGNLSRSDERDVQSLTPDIARTRPGDESSSADALPPSTSDSAKSDEPLPEKCPKCGSTFHLQACPNSRPRPDGLLDVNDLVRYRLALDRAIRAWGLLADHVRVRLTVAFRRAHGIVLKDGFTGGPDIPHSFAEACSVFREALRKLHEFDESPPDFPWPHWGEQALAPVGPLPELEGWLDSLKGMGKEDCQRCVIDPFLNHLCVVSQYFEGCIQRLEQAKEKVISVSENPLATRLRVDKALRQAEVEEHERVEAVRTQRRQRLHQMFTDAHDAMGLTNEPTTEWTKRLTARLISVGQEIIAQKWEDWARENAEGEPLPRGLIELMLKGDQSSIEGVVRELRDLPSELRQLADWLRSLQHDWSCVFDRGWLWWKLNEDLPVSEPQLVVAQPTSQDIQTVQTGDHRQEPTEDTPRREKANNADQLASATMLPSSADVPRADVSRASLPDGTLASQRVWVGGRKLKLTQGLRSLLSFLLTHDGVSEEEMIHHFGFTTSSHLHKRLKDLRDKLKHELQGDAGRLQLKTVETHIYCRWR